MRTDWNKIFHTFGLWPNDYFNSIFLILIHFMVLLFSNTDEFAVTFTALIGVIHSGYARPLLSHTEKASQRNTESLVNHPSSWPSRFSQPVATSAFLRFTRGFYATCSNGIRNTRNFEQWELCVPDRSMWQSLSVLKKALMPPSKCDLILGSVNPSPSLSCFLPESDTAVSLFTSATAALRFNHLNVAKIRPESYTVCGQRNWYQIICVNYYRLTTNPIPLSTSVLSPVPWRNMFQSLRTALSSDF